MTTLSFNPEAGSADGQPVVAFTPNSWDPSTGGSPQDVVTIPKSLLRALVDSAHHLTERYDVTLGNSENSRVEWRCRGDCPVCAAYAALGEESLL